MTKVIECAICGQPANETNEHNGEKMCQSCYDANKDVVKHG